MDIQMRSGKKEFHKYIDLFVDRWVSKGGLEKKNFISMLICSLIDGYPKEVWKKGIS